MGRRMIVRGGGGGGEISILGIKGFDRKFGEISGRGNPNKGGNCSTGGGAASNSPGRNFELPT